MSRLYLRYSGPLTNVSHTLEYPRLGGAMLSKVPGATSRVIRMNFRLGEVMGQTHYKGSERLAIATRTHPGRDLLCDTEWKAVADALSLSDRELEVAKLLFEG